MEPSGSAMKQKIATQVELSVVKRETATATTTTTTSSDLDNTDKTFEQQHQLETSEWIDIEAEELRHNEENSSSTSQTGNQEQVEFSDLTAQVQQDSKLSSEPRSLKTTSTTTTNVNVDQVRADSHSDLQQLKRTELWTRAAAETTNKMLGNKLEQQQQQNSRPKFAQQQQKLENNIISPIEQNKNIIDDKYEQNIACRFKFINKREGNRNHFNIQQSRNHIPIDMRRQNDIGTTDIGTTSSNSSNSINDKLQSLLKTGINSEPLRQKLDPIPRPRGQANISQHHHSSSSSINSDNSTYKLPLTEQLSIVTQNQLLQRQTNSPPISIMSDSTTSTTLIAEAAMNSSELIPKLIERLDRKLIVMKEEQLSLMREIESNESAGQRLFESMKRHLTVNEFEKVTLQANEIEKVTKLILSLKLRLKRVENDLTEKYQHSTNDDTNDHIEQHGQISETDKATPTPTSTPENPKRIQTNSSSLRINDTGNCDVISNGRVVALPKSGSRGISDPTSTTGLPKRTHQHHASLQAVLGVKPVDTDHQSTHKVGESNQCKRNSDNNTSDMSRSGNEKSSNGKTASTSSDSIFNSADSAIGSTITGHGGSGTNIEQPATSHSSLISSSSSHHRHLHHSKEPLSPLESHMSSNISVSSQSSGSIVSSASSCVPDSPLVSPPVTKTGLQVSSLAGQTQSSRFNDSGNGSFSGVLDANNNSNLSDSTISSNDANNLILDSQVRPLTDMDILIAKRNKLVSQLEEAHQLEECIFKRNTVIIQKILKKYYNDAGQEGEIAEFKQFTRLKSLLLKDTHDVADRISNAELQLTELRQSNSQVSS